MGNKTLPTAESGSKTFDISQMRNELENQLEMTRIQSTSDIHAVQPESSTQEKVFQILWRKFLDYQIQLKQFAEAKTQAKVKLTQQMFEDEWRPHVDLLLSTRLKRSLHYCVIKIVITVSPKDKD